MRNNRSNKAIECCRLLATFMIVFIHCPIDSLVGKYVCAISRAAVPFYLLVSGYFAYGASYQQISKKIKDILFVIAYGGGVCFVWNCVNSLKKNGSPLIWMENHLNIDTIIELILFNRADFLNSVFYYFFALLYVYLVLLLAKRLKCIHFFYYLIIPLLCISLLIIRCTELPWYYAGNWIFTGIPFFFTGYYFHFNCLFGRLNTREWFVILIGAILSICEALFIGGGYLNLGAIIIAIGMLAFSINHPADTAKSFKRKNSDIVDVLAWMGSNCSLLIILFHCQVRDTLVISTKITSNQLFWSVALFSLILALSINAAFFLKNALSS